jgi:prevent-host-death family protein
MELENITSTDFQNKAGYYFDETAKRPIVITKHKRPQRVLLDFEEYERLKRYDTRQALYPHELPKHLIAELEKGNYGERNPELDHLME